MKLALGTVQFGLDYGVANTSGRVSIQEAGNILLRARICGLDTLDTAIAYGESEAVLGQLGVQSWKVVTKLPAVPDGCPDIAQWVQEQTQNSMARLGVSQLHGLLLHRPGQLLEAGGSALYAALQDLKAQGLVRKIGVSIYAPTELEALTGRFNVDLIQAPLNILDRRLVDSGWAKRLHDSGVEVHARSVFLQGLLLMPSDLRPAKFNRWADIWTVWDRWLAANCLTPLQGCLYYANSLREVDRVVVGVDSVAQLDEILKAAKGRMTSPPVFKFLQDERLINPAYWSTL